MTVVDAATEPTAAPIRYVSADARSLGVLTLTCPERPGIVQAVTSFLLKHGLDIVEHHQFDDSIREILFLRTAFAAEQPFDPDHLAAEFATTAAEFSMSFSFHDQTKPRMLVMVSKFGHCLNDLIFRWRAGTLGGEIALLPLGIRRGLLRFGRRILRFRRAPLGRDQQRLERGYVVGKLRGIERHARDDSCFARASISQHT